MFCVCTVLITILIVQMQSWPAAFGESMGESNLSHIENSPEKPMELFAEWHEEAKTFSDPELFYDVMTIAGFNDDDGLLNRNVVRRKHDSDGIIFVTERNCKKYTDFLKNPKVAAAFVWIYHRNETVIARQVRIIGTVVELPAAEIAEFYKEEELKQKIRSRICRCGERVDWNELKVKHDQLLKDYREGRDTLPQTDTYTAMRIIPQKFDFYMTTGNEIADRVKYTLEDGKWDKYHIAA